MEDFQVRIKGSDYTITPGLHANFYSISCAGRSGMLTKGDDGEWEFSLQSSEGLDVSAAEIGRAIELYLESRTHPLK
jgi:hypothetical protein